jgi:YHS domain-containing protein
LNRRLLLGAIALLGSGYLLGRAREKPNDTAMPAVQPEPAESSNVALQGYDPVAYFTRGQAVRGDRRISAEHNGVTYHFSNADDKAMFLARPDKYAPQYGGFCAYGTAHDLKLTGDPELWDIVDGKLYLVSNPEAMRAWQQERPSYISRADAIWARIQARRAQAH